MDKKKTILLFCLLYFCISVAFFWRIFLAGEIFCSVPLSSAYPWAQDAPLDDGRAINGLLTDNLVEYVPWRHFAVSQILDGHAPTWNPYSGCGYPFIGDPQSTLFYVLNFPYFMTSAFRGFSFQSVLVIFLSGWFMSCLLLEMRLGRFSSFAGGLIYMFSGPFLCRLVITTQVNAFLWAPLVFLFYMRSIKKRKMHVLLLTSAALAVSITAGNPQITLFILYSLGLLALYKAILMWKEGETLREASLPIRYFMMASLFALLVTAIQILPIAELASYSDHLERPYSVLKDNAVPWQALPSFLIPDYFGTPLADNYAGQNNYVEMTVYLGVTPLLLSLILLASGFNRFNLICFLLALISFLLLIGSPLYFLSYHLLPGFKTSSISRVVFVYAMAVSMLAAMGLERIQRGFDDRTLRRVRTMLRIAAVAALVAVAGYLFLFLFAGGSALAAWLVAFTENRLLFSSFLIKKGIVFFLLFFAALATLYAMAARRLSLPYFRGMLVAIILADVLIFGYGFNVTRPVTAADLAHKDIALLQQDERMFRIARFTDKKTWIFPPNIPSLFDIQDIQISTPITINYYGKLMQSISRNLYNPARPKRVDEIRHAEALESPLLDLLNVRYLLSTVPLASEKYEPLSRGEMSIYLNRKCLPRAFIAFSQKVVGSPEEARAWVSHPDFDPSATVVLEEKIEGLMSGNGVVHIETYHPTEVSMKTCLDEKGILVFSDLYFPGWRAWVDGEEKPVLRANYAFRALALQPGEHEVIFRYSGTWIRTGAVISLTAIFLGVALFFFSLFRERGSF